MHQDPRAFGIPQTRWTLDRLHQVCDWLKVQSRGSLAALLARLKISWQRGQFRQSSPDPDYLAKLAAIAVELEEGVRPDRQRVVVYFDAMAFSTQPTLSHQWGARKVTPLLPRSTSGEGLHRVLGALDGRDGRVVVQRVGERVGVAELVGFWQHLRVSYPEVAEIVVIVDNLPLHFHPDGLVALQPQHFPFPIATPGHWPETPSKAAQQKWGNLRLPLRLVQLPTYAPWTNPIEKLWRKLRQEVLHGHRHADEPAVLLERVDAFFAEVATGSTSLLKYCGLLKPG